MSPLDPVFWTHHNMLDCLWVDWNINLGNANTNDPAWGNQQFSDFVDENGNPVTITVVDSVLLPIFVYQFEPCAPLRQGKRNAEVETSWRSSCALELLPNSNSSRNSSWDRRSRWRWARAPPAPSKWSRRHFVRCSKAIETWRF